MDILMVIFRVDYECSRLTSENAIFQILLWDRIEDRWMGYIQIGSNTSLQVKDD